jgi:hypothetical protein
MDKLGTRLGRRLGIAAGIGGLLALSMGASTRHAQAVPVSNTTFVNSAYSTMLSHRGDPAGVNYWIDQLPNRDVARSTFAMALASTPEYRHLVIGGNGQSGTDFYGFYLHRTFDAAGADNWVDQIARGMSFEQVRLQFVASPEFFSSPRVGNGDRLTAIRALYSDLLGRTDRGDSDSAGQSYCMATSTPAPSRLSSSSARRDAPSW